MATQSLYRRYRPRRFGEVKGQDHVVRALRNAVAEGREGQAYLFSGPRGTGKTTSARILAKVLNCENPVDGEPCCECESCLAVERGTSFDVHELDAASNNGVDAMRDLIEKASLGTPGRHKVYILDEVHMLSKAAEAALLKTLEEPPSHVVFVLATTDPQKMSDTIRSRTQHLQFHLLSADALQEHVRWVADDAGLDVTDEAIGRVVARGGGSPRDTLSALELVANSGGDGAETIAVGELVEAMIDHDPGRGLTMIGQAISLGRDPRTLTDDLIAHLRNGFLSLMAPELVQLPALEVEAVAEQARRLGPPGLVRGIEVLGAALGEMRHAPDPRVLLDVAVVQLTSPSASTDVTALAERLHRLEQQMAGGGGAPAAGDHAAAQAAPAADARSSAAPADDSPDPPRDPSTGRATVGGRARRAAAAETPSPPSGAPDSPPAEPEAPAADPAAPDAAVASEPAAPAADAAGASDAPAPAQPAGAPAEGAGAVVTGEAWEQTVVPGLRGMVRAVYAPASFVGSTPGAVTLALPNDVHRGKCEQHRAAVEDALAAAAGGPVAVELVVAGAPDPPDGGPDASTARGGPSAGGPATETDDDIDLDELVDAPPETVKTPIDRLAEAFPGSELVDERVLILEMANVYTPPVQVLIDELGRLPGVGPKSAQRIAFHLLKIPADDVARLAHAITDAKARVRFCERCFNVAEGVLCPICQDDARDASMLCVVEESRDIVALEKTGEFRGRYHVLLGAMSPLEGIGPEDLKVRELIARLEPEGVSEVILCTNPNTEGEVTAMYLARLLKPLGLKVTRIASGLPVGGDLEYADELTLGRALEGRRRVD